jgi:hypothetical protein
MTDQEKSTARKVHELLLSAHPHVDDIDLVKAGELASLAGDRGNDLRSETLLAIQATRKAIAEGSSGAEAEQLLLKATAVVGHGDGLGDTRVHRSSSGKSAGADNACDGRDGEEMAPRWIAWREHHGVVDCRRACGWRAIHAVSLGHGFASFVARVRAGAEVASFPSA